jgi:hypothetical protein
MDREPSGWILLAAALLGLGAVMRFFDAIWAFQYDGPLPNNFEGAIFGQSLKSYAWVWIAVSAILLVSAALVLGGSQLGRWTGIVAAAISAVTAFAWMPYYPIWSWVYVGIAGLVTYALTVHGAPRIAPGTPAATESLDATGT